MRFTVGVPEDELRKTLRRISVWKARKILEAENILREGTRRVAAGARHRVPADTGRLRKSIRWGFSAAKAEGTVYTAVPYAHLVEFGSRAFTARPKRKKALMFENGGETAFAKKADVPARSAKPFMKPAYDCESPAIAAELKRALGGR